MPITYPNQRTVTIHREAAKSDFLGIKNSNWQSAASNLGAHALMLYLYLASNANGYNLALSPAAITEAIGMPRSTYHDQFQKLINKGYLVERGSSSYDFYEQPQTRLVTTQNAVTADGEKKVEVPPADKAKEQAVQDIPTEDIEINNNSYTPNKSLINKQEIQKETVIKPPEVKIITIPKPEYKPIVRKEVKRGFDF